MIREVNALEPRFKIDETHDIHAESWIESANGHLDFPIQNLPLGIFSYGGEHRRPGIAIGDRILDLESLLRAGLLSDDAKAAAEAANGQTLNRWMGLPVGERRALRRSLFALLSRGGGERPEDLKPMLRTAAECTLHLPAKIGDFTDFFAGINHARNAGRILRPDNPLLPNYKYVPVGYHGRSSSVRVSGAEVRRPHGQLRSGPEAEPEFLPSRKMDFELEIGVWVGVGNDLGETIPIAAAHQHIAGVCLLNDWSARDIQSWEYQPLGPFLAKNFSTTISPWVVTPEALAPYFMPQAPRDVADPLPLKYLTDEQDQDIGALDIECELLLSTEKMRAENIDAHSCCVTSSRHLYWTISQLIAHHASGGCNLQPGDLIGSGTISGPDAGSFGSLLEITENGRGALSLPSGEMRTFLEDGDEVVIRARARREGFATIGFGECRGRIIQARYIKP